MLAERVLGAVIGTLLTELGLSAIPKDKAKSDSSITLEQIKAGIPEEILDLVGAVQAAERTYLLSQVFVGSDFDHKTLAVIETKYSNSDRIGIETLPKEEWLDKVKSPLTKQAQATTSVARLFVDILRRADGLADGVNSSDMRSHQEIKDAIRAIGELAYIHKKQVIDAFEKQAEKSAASSDPNVKQYAEKCLAVADRLKDDLKTVRISQVGKDKDGMFAALFRGITHGLDWLGYRKDGSERGFLGGIFRSMAKITGGMGYELPDSEHGEEKAAEVLMKGIKHGAEAILPELKNTNPNIKSDDIYSWLNKRAEQIEPGLATKIGLAAATETDANVTKVVAEADAKATATEKAKTP